MSASPAPDGVLKPTLSVFDVVAITVSAVTPASSVFVIAPFAIQQAGSGVFLAFVMAALLALMFAFATPNWAAPTTALAVNMCMPSGYSAAWRAMRRS